MNSALMHTHACMQSDAPSGLTVRCLCGHSHARQFGPRALLQFRQGKAWWSTILRMSGIACMCATATTTVRRAPGAAE
jgi:hypothetical protein